MSLTDYHRSLEEHAALKRFNERWVADPTFRSALAEDPLNALQHYHIPCTPDEVRMPPVPDLTDPPPVLRALWQMVVTKTRWINKFYREDGVPAGLEMRAWRDRNIARQHLELGPFHTNSNIHASLSIELSKGCSVGCWFCALSPERLSGVFRHDEPNRELWRGVLSVLAGCLGPAARTGFLYWASDPLDNPDYEKLCVDFHEVIGVFPPTTTALSLVDPARTRALLHLSEARDCWLNRFSVLTLKQLDRVHREFSAKELAHVECLALNRESAFAFGNAGRFRDRSRIDPDLMKKQRKNLRWAPWYTGDPAYAGSEDYPLASIGCVTGFLLNMVSRRVQLISPCASSDRWPLGYCVYDEAGFDTPEQLASEMHRMIETRMPPVLRPADRLRFHDWLGFGALDDGFQLSGRFNARAVFRGAMMGPQWRALGDLVRSADKTSEEIACRVSSELGTGRDMVQAMLDELLRAGVLDEMSF